MKNRFFKLLVFFFILFSFVSCGSLNKVRQGKNKENTEITFGASQMMKQVTHRYNAYQIDSMCVADALPANFNGWIKKTYSDYETNQSIVRYMFIKELNEYNEMIYIVTPRGEMFIVAKRKVTVE